jgi:hypothetical protein
MIRALFRLLARWFDVRAVASGRIGQRIARRSAYKAVRRWLTW